jgi:histidinol dehydrogenase
VPVERLRADGAGAASVAAGVRALVPAGATVADAVRDVIAAVRADGDAAISRYERDFAPPGWSEPGFLRVPHAVLESALQALDQSLRAGLELSLTNVGAVARESLTGDRSVVLPAGQEVLVREVPVHRAGIYAPAGQAPYPSSLVMGIATARAAGVPEVVAVGSHPLMHAVCALAGVEEVYAMGGAHAVAALAYGTETVRPVDVVVGPGSLYAQEAKRQVFGQVGIDGFAGPSDLVVIADGADPEAVALDALAQAEHGTGSAVVVLSADAALLDAVAARCGDVDPALLALVHTDGLQAALRFSEAFAPEHLQLMGPGAEALAGSITRAGCVFVGPAAGTAFGDYVAGTNHVLPTEGAARFASGLNVRHFLRVQTEVRIGPDAAAQLAPAGAAIADAEGFVAHAASMRARGAT